MKEYINKLNKSMSVLVNLPYRISNGKAGIEQLRREYKDMDGDLFEKEISIQHNLLTGDIEEALKNIHIMRVMLDLIELDAKDAKELLNSDQC